MNKIAYSIGIFIGALASWLDVWFPTTYPTGTYGVLICGVVVFIIGMK